MSSRNDTTKKQFNTKKQLRFVQKILDNRTEQLNAADAANGSLWRLAELTSTAIENQFRFWDDFKVKWNAVIEENKKKLAGREIAYSETDKMIEELTKLVNQDVQDMDLPTTEEMDTIDSQIKGHIFVEAKDDRRSDAEKKADADKRRSQTLNVHFSSDEETGPKPGQRSQTQNPKRSRTSRESENHPSRRERNERYERKNQSRRTTDRSHRSRSGRR